MSFSNEPSVKSSSETHQACHISEEVLTQASLTELNEGVLLGGKPIKHLFLRKTPATAAGTAKRKCITTYKVTVLEGVQILSVRKWEIKATVNENKLFHMIFRTPMLSSAALLDPLKQLPSDGLPVNECT